MIKVDKKHFVFNHPHIALRARKDETPSLHFISPVFFVCQKF